MQKSVDVETHVEVQIRVEERILLFQMLVQHSICVVSVRTLPSDFSQSSIGVNSYYNLFEDMIIVLSKCLDQLLLVGSSGLQANEENYL